MDRISLKGTDLYVSPFSLGCANFGASVSDESAVRQMDVYTSYGGNFFDTARIYAAWANRGDALSERLIGKWLKESKNRHDIVISTKGAHMFWESMDVSRVYASCIREDIDNSLKMLGTDYIDLFFMHRDRIETPIEEILVPLEEAVKKGKIRYYGCSNFSLERIKEAADFAKENGFKGFSVNQVMWGLPDIKLSALDKKNTVPMDKETYAYMLENNMSAMAYSSMSGNYFGKILSGKDPGERRKLVYNCKVNEEMSWIFEKYKDSPDMTQIGVLLSYFRLQELPSVPIISFSSEEHLIEAFYALNHLPGKKITEEFIKIKKFTEL